MIAALYLDPKGTYTPDSEGERPRRPWGGIDEWRDSGGTSSTPPAFRDVLLSIARSAT